MAVLVTGAAGFIGSHVAEALVARGDSVVAIDNFDPYYSPERKRANLSEIAQTPGTGRLDFVEGDLRDAQVVARLFDQHEINAVAHLAAMPGIRPSMGNPALWYEVNLTATLNLLNCCREAGVGHMVFASTSSVYGATRTVPFIETDPCDRPLAPYPASKRSAEMLGYTYHHLYGLNFTAVRFFTVYGPRSRPDMMAHKVADNITYGREVPLYDEGRVYRDWTYIGDITDGVLRALDRPMGYEIINLGRGEPVLLADFVRHFEDLAGKRARLVPAPLPDSDMPVTSADITKARNLLAYDPKVSVAQGVSAFWSWYERAVSSNC